MIVLTLEDPHGIAGALAEAFAARGHVVHAASDIANAVARAEATPPDVVVAPAGNAEFPQLVASVRAHHLAYVIGVLAGDETNLQDVVDGVAPDEILFSDTREAEIKIAVHAAERIVSFSRRLQERVGELEHALSHDTHTAADAPESEQGIRKALLTRGWREMEATLERMCGEYLNLPFHRVANPGSPSEGLGGARISLTDVEHNVELDLGVFCSEKSTRDVAIAFCGGDESMVDDDIMRDVMTEFANSAMGAVKTDFLDDDFRFTAGVPKAALSNKLSKQLSAQKAHRVFCFRNDGTEVFVVVGLHSKEVVRVTGTGLREGMVLASDVFADNGVLLARAGTRLTETTAQRLSKLVPKKLIELSEAA
ncbi:MAG: hypothetical protein KC776_39770 [Myxococcales bacterium]|nr:hypothetical protein [Myxococcales bacterium]MCB9579270.1 hypothetical protein [Polyangiaceae bacterium]